MKIDWEHLGYPWIDGLLKKLTSDKREERDKVYDTLIEHQLLHSIHSPTLYFVPYFISLLRRNDVPEKGELMIPLTEWAFECRNLNADEFDAKIFVELKKGIDAYETIKNNHDDEETRLIAERLLWVLSDDWTISNLLDTDN